MDIIPKDEQQIGKIGRTKGWRRFEMPWNKQEQEEEVPLPRQLPDPNNQHLPPQNVVFNKEEMMRKNAEMAQTMAYIIKPWADAFGIDMGSVAKKAMGQAITKGTFDFTKMFAEPPQKKEPKFIVLIKTLAVYAPIFIFLMSAIVLILFFEFKILIALSGKI